LEATSIASTIQQIDQLVPYVASYKPGNTAMQKAYNKSFNIMLDNILTMIRMHYITDRDDTDFWTAASNMPVNDTLQDLLNLLRETTLPRDYITAKNGELFQVAHFLHVAQGQGLVKISNLDWTLGNLSVYDETHYLSRDIESQRMGVELVDHAEALNEIEKE
jgi:hypothetical protein